MLRSALHPYMSLKGEYTGNGYKVHETHHHHHHHHHLFSLIHQYIGIACNVEYNFI
jgi:hypothetical protein